MKPSSDREAVTIIATRLSAAGCTFTGVVEDTWCPDDVTPVDTFMDVPDLVGGVDEAWVYVTLPDGTESWIRFVNGNDPEEVVCDHGVNLSPFIDPIVTPWWS